MSDLPRLPLSLLPAIGFGLASLIGPAPALQARPAAAGTPAVTPVTGLVTIESDLQRADNLTGVVTASGNVRIVYPDRRVVATARQAQYFSREGRVVLSGDVDVIQDNGPSIRADRLTYLVQQERLVAEPLQGQQVMSRIPITTTPDPAASGTP